MYVWNLKPYLLFVKTFTDFLIMFKSSFQLLVFIPNTSRNTDWLDKEFTNFFTIESKTKDLGMLII